MKKPLFDEIGRFTQKKGSSRKIGKKDFLGSNLGFDSFSNSKFESTVLSDSKKIWNGILFVIFLLCFSFIFIAKLFSMQIISGKENLSLAEGNRVRVISSLAERGLILDKNGEVLVRNRPAFSLLMDTTYCRQSVSQNTCEEDLKTFIAKFALVVDSERLVSDINSGKEKIIIKSDMTKNEIIPIEAVLGNFPSFSISISPERDYLYSEAFAHLIGYVGLGETLQPTVEGKMGIEQSYNDILTGVDGGEILQVDSSGQKIYTLSQKEAIPGQTIKLSVDKSLQNLAHEKLKEKIDTKKEAFAGTVVAQDPKTGEVLALVSYPAFDPNKLSTGISQSELNVLSNDERFPFFNRAISAAYPPASTFKMVMASAMLAEKILDPSYQITDNGFIQVGSFIFRNWKLDGHGLVDLKRALQVSNDTYFYTVGGGYAGVGGLGIEKIAEWSKKFGLGSKTGINLAGEVAGFVPDGKYRDWYLGDTYITSIGQGDMLSTPLQINNLMTYFVNGGYIYIPKLLASEEPEIIANKLIDEKSYEIVREGLRMAVNSGGTGYPLFDFTEKTGKDIIGKTGTAEFGVMGEYKTHAWFTAATEDLAITVFLEDGGGGAEDAAPIARELFDLWYNVK